MWFVLLTHLQTINAVTGDGDKRPALGVNWLTVPNVRLLLGKETAVIDEEAYYYAAVESSNNSVCFVYSFVCLFVC
jgi:hypothetical protein